MRLKLNRTAGPLESFAAKFATSDVNLEAGSFKGMASVFGSVVDAWVPTIIERGAFAKTLLEDRGRVKVLWQHETSKPIGVPTEMVETYEGLAVTAKISQTALGKDALTLLRDGVIDELSIGFDPVRTEERTNEENRPVTRHIFEAKLWEFSLVTFAADPMAKIQAVHAAARRAIESGQLDTFLRSVLDATDPDTTSLAFSACAALLREAHEGKVLSGRNRGLVSDAITALQALLDAAEPKSKPDSEDVQTRADVDAHEQRLIAASVASKLRTLALDQLGAYALTP
jgi:HK97 family phage prohead protease